MAEESENYGPIIDNLHALSKVYASKRHADSKIIAAGETIFSAMIIRLSEPQVILPVECREAWDLIKNLKY